MTELPRTLVEMGILLAAMPGLAALPRGDGHPVLLLPGFMAGDESMTMLRSYLRYMGYKPESWNLGRNTGKPELLQNGLMRRVEELKQKYPNKFSIIGQSLGGVYAREIARIHPEAVRQVITLGSPFGVNSSESTMRLVGTLFKQQSGLSVEEMRDFIMSLDPHISPPIPVTAVYSKGDGVVNWRVCLEADEDDLTQNIRVCGSHCGMGFNAFIYLIAADRLSQPEDSWQKFNTRRFPGDLSELVAA